MDERIVEALVRLKIRVLTGEVTDWQPPVHHCTSMTCDAFPNERKWLASWRQQFSEIVKASGFLLGPSPWKKGEAA